MAPTEWSFVKFDFFENRAVYEIMWKNIVELGRSHMTVWHMRTAHWIRKATNTPSDYATLFCSSTAKVVA